MAENTGVHSGATTLTSSKKEKRKRKKKTSPAEVPQVMKPILSQGSEKHHILSSFAYSLPSLLPPMPQPVQHTKPIPQKTELSHYIFLLHLSKILQKENPELFLFFILFYFISVEQHSHIFPDPEPEFKLGAFQ